jgi:hypothetical protein
MRYILNRKGSKKNINDGEKCNTKKEVHYIEHYKSYIHNSFNNFFDYIITLFEKNNTSLQKYYQIM